MEWKQRTHQRRAWAPAFRGSLGRNAADANRASLVEALDRRRFFSYARSGAEPLPPLLK
jgi:hypothetical protein